MKWKDKPLLIKAVSSTVFVTSVTSVVTSKEGPTVNFFSPLPFL